MGNAAAGRPAATWKPPAEEEGGTSIPSVAPINMESGFTWPEKEVFLFEEVLKNVVNVINPSRVGSSQKSI